VAHVRMVPEEEAGGSAVPVLIVAAPAERAHPTAGEPSGGGASAV